MNLPVGWLCEIFSSIQGEGVFCGQKQTFIRMAGCNLSCRYCDTAESRLETPQVCRIETVPGSGVFEELPNPIGIETITTTCANLHTRVAAFTGGEPLKQIDFLALMLDALTQCGCITYLETNGTLYENLAEVIDIVDIVAMDIKLPSSSGAKGLWEAHEQFLGIAAWKHLFVKVVVDTNTTENEIARCRDMINDLDSDIALVIQPKTGENLSGAFLMGLQDIALEKLNDVRVIPQCHKLLGVL